MRGAAGNGGPYRDSDYCVARLLLVRRRDAATTTSSDGRICVPRVKPRGWTGNHFREGRLIRPITRNPPYLNVEECDYSFKHSEKPRVSGVLEFIVNKHRLVEDYFGRFASNHSCFETRSGCSFAQSGVGNQRRELYRG